MPAARSHRRRVPTIPTGFIPAQDKGYLIVAIQLPDGASIERTDAVVRRAGGGHLAHAGRPVRGRVRAGFGRDARQQRERGCHLRRPEAVGGAASRADGQRAPRDAEQRLSEIEEASIFVIPPPP